MIELSPKDFLPQNYESFKQQIPNLRIAEHLSSKNPFKRLLSNIENYRRHGTFYNVFLFLMLLCFMQIVVRAFIQNHPSSWGMLLLVLPIFGAAYVSRKSSPFKQESLMQIILLPCFRILRKAFNSLPRKDPKWQNQKKGTIQLSASYELKFELRHLQPTFTPEQRQIKQIKSQLVQILKERAILLLGSILGGIFYYQLAFYVGGNVLSNNDKFASAIIDIFMINAELSPYAFQNMFLLSLLAINFMLYSGDIFLPYEQSKIRQYIKSSKTGFFEKIIYRPLVNLSLIILGLVALIYVGAFTTILYTSIYAVPAKEVLFVLILAPYFLYHYLFILWVALIRKIGIFFERYC